MNELLKHKKKTNDCFVTSVYVYKYAPDFANGRHDNISILWDRVDEHLFHTPGWRHVQQM